MSRKSCPNCWLVISPPCLDGSTLDDRALLLLLESRLPPPRATPRGKLSAYERYGKRNHIRLLRCKASKGCLSERNGTPVFDCRLPDEKAHAVFAHLAKEWLIIPAIQYS